MLALIQRVRLLVDATASFRFSLFTDTPNGLASRQDWTISPTNGAQEYILYCRGDIRGAQIQEKFLLLSAGRVAILDLEYWAKPTGGDGSRWQWVRPTQYSGKATAVKLAFSGTDEQPVRIGFSPTEAQSMQIPFSPTADQPIQIPFSGTADQPVPIRFTDPADRPLQFPFTDGQARSVEIPFSSPDASPLKIAFSSGEETAVPFRFIDGQERQVKAPIDAPAVEGQWAPLPVEDE